MSTNVAQQSEGNDTLRSQPLKSPSRLLRKLTTRFKPQTLHPKSANLETASPPRSPTQPSNRRSAVPIAPTDVAAVRRRQAALQQCGLVSLPKKDLSQLEEELDRKFTRIVVLPQDQQDQDELTTAEKIRREWQSKNEEQFGKQGNDADPKDPNDIPSDPLDHERPEKPGPKSPVPLSPIQETFPVPEEDVAVSEIEKEISTPLPETADPLIIPLPHSPSPSSTNFPDLPPPPPPRESKWLSPIVVNLTANDDKETQDQVTRGRSLSRDSPQSFTSKPSLPALSPTMTTSSSSSIPTPRDDESRERMEAAITRSNTVKSPPSRFGKATHFRHHSEELGVVHETIHESPEPSLTESRTWNPNGDSNAMGSAGFEEPAEKKSRRRMSTGFFQPSRRNSGSIRSSNNSISSGLSSMWSAIANDFSLKQLDGGKPRSSASPATLTSADENKEFTPAQPQAANQSKITGSKSVIASLGFKKARKTAQPAHSPSPPPSPMRRPTIKIMENREILMQEVRGIEDDESRRLTEMAFMDF